MFDFVSPCEALCVYFGGSVFLFSVLVWFLPHCFKLGVMTMIVADIALAAGIAFPRRLTELLNEQGITEAMLPPIEDALLWGVGAGIGFFILCFALYYLVVLRKLKHLSQGSGVTYDKNSPQAQYQSPKSHNADAGSAKASFKASKGNADLPLTHDDANEQVTEGSRISVTVGDDEESAPKKFLKQKQRRRGRRNLRLDSNNLENDSLSSLEGNPLYAGVKDDVAQEVRLSPTNAVEPELNSMHKNPLDGVVADSELGHGSAVLVDQALSGVKISSGTDSVLLSPARELQESILDDAAQKAAAAEAKSAEQKAQIDHTQSSIISERAAFNAGNPTLRSIEPERLERLSELTPEADETGSVTSDLHPNTEQILAHVHGTNYNLPERTSDLGSIPFDTTHGESIDVEVMPGSKVGDVLSAIEDGRMPEGFAQSKPQVDIAKESSFSFADMLDSAQKYQKHGLGNDDEILVDVTDDIAHNEQLSHQDLGLDKLSMGTVPPAEAMSHPELQEHENEQNADSDLGEDALEEQPIFVKRSPHHLTVDEALHSLEQAELEQSELAQSELAQEKVGIADLAQAEEEQVDIDQAQKEQISTLHPELEQSDGVQGAEHTESQRVGQYKTAGELLHSLEQQDAADKLDKSGKFTSEQGKETIAPIEQNTANTDVDNKTPVVTLDPDFDNPTASASSVAQSASITPVVPATPVAAVDSVASQTSEAFVSSHNDADVEGEHAEGEHVEGEHAEEFDVLGIVPELVESTQIVHPQTLDMPRDLTKLMRESSLDVHDELAKADKSAVERSDKLAVTNASVGDTHELARKKDSQNLETHKNDASETSRHAVHGSYQFAMPVGSYGNYGQAQYIAHLDAQELSNLFTPQNQSDTSAFADKSQTNEDQLSSTKLNATPAAVDSEVKQADSQPIHTVQVDENAKSKVEQSQSSSVLPAEHNKSLQVAPAVTTEQSNDKIEQVQAPAALVPQALPSDDIALDIIPTIPAAPLSQDLSDDITPSIPVPQPQDDALVVDTHTPVVTNTPAAVVDTHTPAEDSHAVTSVLTNAVPVTNTSAAHTPAPHTSAIDSGARATEGHTQGVPSVPSASQSVSGSQDTVTSAAANLAQDAVQNKQANIAHTAKTLVEQPSEQSKASLKQQSAVSSEQDKLQDQPQIKQQDQQQTKLQDQPQGKQQDHQPAKLQGGEVSLQPADSQSGKQSVKPARQQQKVAPSPAKKLASLSGQRKSTLVASASAVSAQTPVHKPAAPQLAQSQLKSVVQSEQAQGKTPAASVDSVKTVKAPVGNQADAVKTTKAAGGKTIDENRTHLAPKRAAMRRLGRGIASLSQRAVEYGSNYQPAHALNPAELSKEQNVQSLAVPIQKNTVNQERVNTTGSKAATALAPVLSHTPLSPVTSPAPHAQAVNQSVTQPLASSLAKPSAQTSAQVLGQEAAHVLAPEGSTKVRSSLKSGFGKGLSKPANNLAARNVSALLNANRAQEARSTSALYPEDKTQTTAAQTAAQVQPTDRVKSTENIKPAASANLAESTKPIANTKKADSVKSAESIKAIESAKPAEGIKAIESVKSKAGESVKSAASAKTAVNITPQTTKTQTPHLVAERGQSSLPSSVAKHGQSPLSSSVDSASLAAVKQPTQPTHSTGNTPVVASAHGDIKTLVQENAQGTDHSLVEKQQSPQVKANEAKVNEDNGANKEHQVNNANQANLGERQHKSLHPAVAQPATERHVSEQSAVAQPATDIKTQLEQNAPKLNKSLKRSQLVKKSPSAQQQKTTQTAQMDVMPQTSSHLGEANLNQTQTLAAGTPHSARSLKSHIQPSSVETIGDKTVDTAQLAAKKSAPLVTENTVEPKKVEQKLAEPQRVATHTAQQPTVESKTAEQATVAPISQVQVSDAKTANTLTSEPKTLKTKEAPQARTAAKKLKSNPVNVKANTAANTVAHAKTALRSAKLANAPEQLKSEKTSVENQRVQLENSPASLSQSAQTTQDSHSAQNSQSVQTTQESQSAQPSQIKQGNEGQGKSLARGPRVKPALQPHKNDKILSKSASLQGHAIATQNRQSLAVPPKEQENTLVPRKHSLAKTKSALGKVKTSTDSEQGALTEVSSQEHP